MLGAGLYLLGARSVGELGRRPWPRWRTAAFLAGIAALAAAAFSPIDRVAEELFSMHMVQHMLIVTIGAPLILLGAPVVPLVRGTPRELRRVLHPVVSSGSLRAAVGVLRHPLVAGLAYVAGLYAWHVPGLYDLAVSNRGVHELQHGWYVLSALLLWSVVIDPEPFRATLPPGARILYLVIVGAAQNTILGGILVFSSRPLYSSYATSPLRYGIQPLTDQQAGGAIMWSMGSLIFFIAASLAFFRWLEAEEHEQRAREEQWARERHGAER